MIIKVVKTKIKEEYPLFNNKTKKIYHLLQKISLLKFQASNRLFREIKNFKNIEIVWQKSEMNLWAINRLRILKKEEIFSKSI